MQKIKGLSQSGRWKFQSCHSRKG